MSSPGEKREIPSDLVVLAGLLDSKFRLPLGIRIGWDGILGLIPGIGDVITTLLSAYLIARAAMFGVAPVSLLRMGLNVLIDNGISMIPFFGWIGDFAWKSNLKNIDLLRRHAADPTGTSRRSGWIVFGVLFSGFVFLLGTAILAGYIGWKVVQLLLVAIS